jgi:predicted DNA-binding antitoxin AbrB/MazE fold protein
VVFTTQAVYTGGVLKPIAPLAIKDGETVEVTISTVGPTPSEMSQDEWRQKVLSTAGKWQGEFERPELGIVEEREPLS